MRRPRQWVNDRRPTPIPEIPSSFHVDTRPLLRGHRTRLWHPWPIGISQGAVAWFQSFPLTPSADGQNREIFSQTVAGQSVDAPALFDIITS
jgi:hypothetical protein